MFWGRLANLSWRRTLRQKSWICWLNWGTAGGRREGLNFRPRPRTLDYRLVSAIELNSGFLSFVDISRKAVGRPSSTTISRTFIYFTWPEPLPHTFLGGVRGLLRLDLDLWRWLAFRRSGRLWRGLLSRLALGLPLHLATGLPFSFHEDWIEPKKLCVVESCRLGLLCQRKDGVHFERVVFLIHDFSSFTVFLGVCLQTDIY